MLKIGGHRVDSNAADYFRMMPDGVISKTLIHLMERPPGRTSRHIERLLRRPRSCAASMAWRLMRV